ncbi:translocase [Rhodobacteraceae bacterium CCMM004]|nr:translocase [Rhodobacteraceae bacterium CCMM004]
MRKTLTSPYVVGMASRLAGQVVAFLLVMVAARYLGLAEFGTYALGWAATVIANSFIFTGLYQALLRSGDYDRDRDTLFWMNLGVGLAGAAVIAAVGLWAGGLESPVGRTMLSLAPLPIALVWIAWNEAQLVRDKRTRAASLYVAVAEVSALAAVWVLLEQGWGVGALVAGRYVSTLTGLILTTALVRAVPRLRMARAGAAAARKTALPLWGTTTLGMFSNYGADLILGAFLTPAAVGAYRSGARISVTAGDLVMQPLNMLSWSRFTRLEREGDRDGMQVAWRENMALGAAILWPTLLSIAVLAVELITVVFDESWLPAAPIVVLLCAARGMGFVAALLDPVLLSNGRGALQVRVRLANAVILLALLLGIGRFSGEAAAMAHVLTGFSVAGLGLWAIGHVLGLGWRAILAPFAPAAALTVATAGVLAATAPIRADLGPGAGLALAVGAVAVLWFTAMAIAVRRRILVLPTP